MKKNIFKVICFVCIISILNIGAYADISSEAMCQLNKIDTALLEQMSLSDNDAIIPVMVWRKDVSESDLTEEMSLSQLNVSEKDVDALLCERREAYRKLCTEANTQWIDLMIQKSILTKADGDVGCAKEVTFVSQYTPTVSMRLTKEQIRMICLSDDVVEVCYEPEMCVLDCDTMPELTEEPVMVSNSNNMAGYYTLL